MSEIAIEDLGFWSLAEKKDEERVSCVKLSLNDNKDECNVANLIRKTLF